MQDLYVKLLRYHLDTGQDVSYVNPL